MAKYNLQVPGKAHQNLTVLGAKFANGVPVQLQWFTQKGWDLIPDELTFTKQGQRERVRRGGWIQVSSEDFEPAPSPLTADQVKAPAAPAVDPNAPVVTTGTDAKNDADEAAAKLAPAEANNQLGEPGKDGSESKEASDGKKAPAPDSKAGKK